MVVTVLFCFVLFIDQMLSITDCSCIVGVMFIVGTAMITQLKDAKWDDRLVTVALLGTVIMMLLTYSIINGIVFGIIFYCVFMIGARCWREVSPILYDLVLISLLYLVMVVRSF